MITRSSVGSLIPFTSKKGLLGPENLFSLLSSKLDTIKKSVHSISVFKWENFSHYKATWVTVQIQTFNYVNIYIYRLTPHKITISVLKYSCFSKPSNAYLYLNVTKSTIILYEMGKKIHQYI